MLASMWVDISEDDPIRQGDILVIAGPDNEERWKFILTADCDIAQGKAGQHYTCLEIISAQRWLELYWAPEQLRRILERSTRSVLQPINAKLKQKDSNLTPLNAERLHLWLKETDESELLAAVYGDDSPEPRTKRMLSALRMVLTSNGEAPLTLLKDVHRTLEKPIEELQSIVREVFSTGGFPDFFFLPELPEQDSKGFILLLRDITSISMDRVLSSEREARLVNRLDALYRVGRLNDRLRFAISQKLAFLFSRIGLDPTFESACEETAEILAAEISLQGAKPC